MQYPCFRQTPYFGRSAHRVGLDVRWFRIHRASSTPAFISLLFLPFPFSFHKNGAGVPAKWTYAAQSDLYMKLLKKPGGGELHRGEEMEGIDSSTAEPEIEPEKPTIEMERVATRDSRLCSL